MLLFVNNRNSMCLFMLLLIISSSGGAKEGERLCMDPSVKRVGLGCYLVTL